jgi:hypothetical protein
MGGFSNGKAVFALFILMVVIVIGMMVIAIYYRQEEVPGVAWKIPFETFPELNAIRQKFAESCEIPNIPPEYTEDTLRNKNFQQVREECDVLTQDLDEKYTLFETGASESLAWSKDISRFSESTYDIKDTSKNCGSSDCSRMNLGQYYPRMGCYGRYVPEYLTTFAAQKINELMLRLNLDNHYERDTDSRGSTYTPPGGFMEMHTNRDHFAGWRMYIHYLPEEGVSYFSYRHPYDQSYRRIYDENNRFNLFRIRKLPDKLLWHSIRSETPRFSWGLWVPPELAQYLKTFGERV